MSNRNGTNQIEVDSQEEKIWINKELQEMESDENNPVEDRKELIEDLFEKAEAYAKTNLELFKVKTVDKLAVVVASLISRLLVLVVFSFFFLMINIGLAIWIGEYIGHVYYGFFIIAGLYALISIFLFAFRDPIIKNPIINSIISQVLKK